MRTQTSSQRLHRRRLEQLPHRHRSIQRLTQPRRHAASQSANYPPSAKKSFIQTNTLDAQNIRKRPAQQPLVHHDVGARNTATCNDGTGNARRSNFPLSPSTESHPTPQTPTAPCYSGNNETHTGADIVDRNAQHPQPEPHTPPTADHPENPHEQPTAVCATDTSANTADSISPISIRNPRIFNLIIARPRYSKSPALFHDATSPVRYNTSPALNGFATNRVDVNPA